MRKLLCIFLVLICSSCLYAQDNRGNIGVVVTGFRNSKGKAGITLFDNAKGFPMQSKTAIEKTFVEIDKNSSK